jgi:hypothetical protein
MIVEGSWFLEILMSGTPLELESFPEKVEGFEKALIYQEEDTDQFLKTKKNKFKIKGSINKGFQRSLLRAL